MKRYSFSKFDPNRKILWNTKFAIQIRLLSESKEVKKEVAKCFDLEETKENKYQKVEEFQGKFLEEVRRSSLATNDKYFDYERQNIRNWNLQNSPSRKQLEPFQEIFNGKTEDRKQDPQPIWSESPITSENDDIRSGISLNFDSKQISDSEQVSELRSSEYSLILPSDSMNSSDFDILTADELKRK